MIQNDPDSLIYYGDAVSHLIIAKRITDSITPGIAQFGSIWLPMTHLMLVPFVANNFLFQTGLAGTIVSGVCTAISAMFLFRITKLHFRSNFYGYLACSIFLMNSSVIYMSIVPMMEAPFMMFFIMASYYALRWYIINRDSNDLWLEYRTLLKCGISITAATLTRYEAWFFPVGLVIMILIILLWERRELWKRKIEAFLSIAATYSFLGIFLWTIYNAVIFRNPLIFLTGPYSAQAQSLTRPYRQHLVMQPINSLTTLLGVATDMYGVHIVVLSIVGAVAFVYTKRRTLVFSLLTLVMLAFPILLDYFAMIQGSGEIYKHITTGWFNGRYLVFIAPLFAFSCTALVFFISSIRTKILTGGIGTKLLTGAFVFLIISSYGTFMYFHPLKVGETTALADGTILPYRGDSSYAIDVANALKKLYHGGRILDVTLSKSSPLIQLYSGIPLKNFIDVNNRIYWKDSNNQPWMHVDYLMMQKPIEHLSGLSINQTQYYDPVTKLVLNWTNSYSSLISPWQPVGDSLLSSIRVVYENPDFIILKNDKKDLVLDRLADNLSLPFNMAELGKDDIVLAEKKTGQVHRIVNGHMLPTSILDVNVATRGDRGLLGMAATKNQTGGQTYVFLYYTQSTAEDGDDVNGYREPLGNRLYRYELVNNELTNPKLLIDTPASVTNLDMENRVLIGPDQNVYLLVSNLSNSDVSSANKGNSNDIIINPQGGKINILKKSNDSNMSYGETVKLIKLTQDGRLLPLEINDINDHFKNEIKKHSEFGIRENFHMTVDPLSKRVWVVDNENSNNNENLINSTLPLNSTIKTFGNGSNTEFGWNKNSGPIDIAFTDSNKLGKEYRNDLFVGDRNNGDLYHYDLNRNRTNIILNASLTDKANNSNGQPNANLLLTGLGGITNIMTGKDGYVYFTTIDNSTQPGESASLTGSIYRFKGFEK